MKIDRDKLKQDLKIKISNLEDSIENINKELEGLAKLQEIAVKASKTKPKPKLKTKTKKGV